MKKKRLKKTTLKRKRLVKKKFKVPSILPLLFAIALLSLFSETMRTIPAGAKSENFLNIPFELPKLNSNIALDGHYLIDTCKGKESDFIGGNLLDNLFKHPEKF